MFLSHPEHSKLHSIKTVIFIVFDSLHSFPEADMAASVPLEHEVRVSWDSSLGFTSCRAILRITLKFPLLRNETDPTLGPLENHIKHHLCAFSRMSSNQT